MKSDGMAAGLEISVHEDMLFLSGREEMECPYLAERLFRMEFIYPVRENPQTA